MASSSSSSPEISAPPSNHRNRTEHSLHHKLHEVLEDLSSRFILNLPEVELASLERVCFQVEQAHWYYEDFIRDEDPSFPTMTLKKFSSSLFNVCPFLKQFGHDHDQAFQSFLAYKTRVPVCGAIMLNETWDKCLLVKGWKSTAAWSFPKGKINEQEPPYRCAIREVLEETGYDLDTQIIPEDVVDISIREQSISLFIVPNVPEDFPFETRTRKEISKISWFKLADLPTWKRNKPVPGKFYLIAPFIGPIKTYIRDRKPQNLSRKPPRRPAANHSEPRPRGSSDEEALGTTHSLTAPSAQGSSSQSSSIDNGEPLTPSPSYSEPILKHPTDASPPANAMTGEVEQTANPDPHLAFLLKSLTKSAMSIPVQNAENPPRKSSIPESPTIHPTVLTSVQASHVEVVGPTSHPRSSSATSHTAQPSPTPSRSSTTQHIPSRASPHITTLQSVSSQSTFPQGSAGPISPRSSRRATGLSADISPYFSRAAAVPGIQKHMKYLTMLESVAKESERMTPKLERQTQILNDMIPSQLPNNMPIGSGHALPPMHPGIGESFPMHPSALGGPFGSNMPSGPSLSNLSQRDPFTVRPRTSNTYHPAPYPPPHLSRASMSDEQLRYMMAGISPRLPTAHVSGPFNPYIPPPTRMEYPIGHIPAVAPPFPYPPSHPTQPPLRVVLPQFLPNAPREPGPLTAPVISPAFNLSARHNPVNNAHLLSILNTPSVPRAVNTVVPPTMDSHA